MTDKSFAIHSREWWKNMCSKFSDEELPNMARCKVETVPLARAFAEGVEFAVDGNQGSLMLSPQFTGDMNKYVISNSSALAYALAVESPTNEAKKFVALYEAAEKAIHGGVPCTCGKH